MAGDAQPEPRQVPRASVDPPSIRLSLPAAVAASLLIAFSGVFDHSLWTPDEPRVAEIAREMLTRGDPIVPTLAGEPFLETPPFSLWVIAGFYRLFGVSDGVARISGAAAFALTLFLVFDLTRRIADPFAGLLATIVTGTTSGVYYHFHRVVVDPWLAFWVTLGYWAFIAGDPFSAAPRSPGRARRSALAILAIHGAAGMAFLVKGPVGPGLIWGPVLLAAVLGRCWSFLRSWVHIPGFLLLMALAAFWPVALYARGGRAMSDVFLIGNLVHRFLPTPEGVYRGGHGRPMFYYLAAFPLLVLPWIVALPAVGHWLWRKQFPASWDRRAIFFLASIFPVGFLMLSVPETKRDLYLLPVLPPLGATVGIWLRSAGIREHAHPVDRWTQVLLAVLMNLAGACLVAWVSIFCVLHPDFWERYRVTLHVRPSAGIVALLGAVICLLLAALTLAWGRSRRSGQERAGAWVAAMALSLFVVGGPLVYHGMDGAKNLHVLTSDLTAMGAFSPTLGGYRLDEVTRGIIPYDTGQVPERLETAEDLRRFLRDHPSAKVLLLEKHRDSIPKDVRGLLHPVRRWAYSRGRVYQLMELAPTPNP